MRPVSFTTQNHYVPQWYQRRFYPDGLSEQKVYYLDLTPERKRRGDGGFYTRSAVRRLGVKECFKEDHLYTLFFRNYPSDQIEKRFFGVIDDRGTNAVDFFSNYDYKNGAHEAVHDLLRFMDAQKLRTPKGLDFIRKLTRSKTSQEGLVLMGDLWQMHITIWMEGVWEIVSCDNSTTNFIMTDHPVTTYNKCLFPGSPSCAYPNDAEIERVGTHTIFPLSLTRCLVITNLGYVRNPKANGLRIRENPRYFEQTMFDLRKIQTGRQVSETDVLAINYILKNRAKRYIASHRKEWLYPERDMDITMWNKLGSKYFLFPDPRKVSFTTGFFAGNDRGPTFSQDEYGRIPNDNDPNVRRKRDKEWKSFHDFKDAWDAMYGPLSREEFVKYV